ncbi:MULTISPECIES: phosphomannomutase/phosphoglucomutase [Paenarthrobacter]|uniref:Phosphomannomutase/phosphoglucomutase n=1 Tax=Paenarthrobacter ureafaciens TaxID=37931 RepID=A0AAX3EMY6_PAEUR|nr:MULTISPECIES: phosphomannomutase/phosphoglucomutase [Paenarthrobacter]NKR14021.1 phosphomannomutase/phosphoglucomutase [Arthrobacter sp. M5]NKR17819.1 phosphomannomutase/phosphoglucomutase [Arthrobacter sp. M6]OEH56671.1 phosphomannomutase/phosphoglucomutase [Arthrobacter sp. D2]OEH57895.1 phosphomannomutase/phosphoglucomutase [Arthrobacter sp. D4]MDO5864441.1 phosphomannomutase/phosphoglucomutase [Paenarthrobacter sp. SD-2]
MDLSSAFKAYDVRGIVGDSLTDEAAEAIGAAFVDVLGLAGRKVLCGGDMRPSSRGFVSAFSIGASRRGAEVYDLGLISTDELYFASGALDAAGAIFTASHNPSQYNGIKMAKAGAVPISSDSGLLAIRDLAQRYLDGGYPTAERAGNIAPLDVLGDYAAKLRTLIDLDTVRPLKVVVDAGNGMAGLTVPAVLGNELLDGLPLTIVPLYFELDGTFPNHPANPLEPENLLDLRAAVLEHGADIGLAFDGDADRCFVVDETGRAVSPSAITAMIAVREIARAQAQGEAAPTVIHNLITSRAVPEFVEQAGGRPVRTRVGHSFIKARMAEENAVFGGEHSAHYYFRDFYNADTGLLAAMHVLAALGEQDAPLSTLAGKFEPYSASGEINSTVTDADQAIAAVRNSYEPAPGVAFDESDGLTIAAESGHWWFNVRASNTEELLRLNVEANDAATMQSVRDTVLDLIRN